MPLIKPLLLGVFRLLARRAGRRFEKALADPQAAQQATLRRVLRAAGPAAFPPGSSAAQRRDPAFFRSLPLQDYEALAPRIAAARERGRDFLSRRRPLAYEPTSGSSGARKLIPYPASLLQSFTELFLCWGDDLLRNGPAVGLELGRGRLYFSVSPQLEPDGDGLSDDSDYLSGPTAWLFRQFALSPPVQRLRDPADFFEVLALYLLAAEDLEVISVWSPSFLLTLLERLRARRAELAPYLAQGEITRQGQRFVWGPVSAAQVARVADAQVPLAELFPALRLISCWGAENARVGFAQLQGLFPDVWLQEKGLLATEAPLTLPLLSQGNGCCLPLLQSVFFEFRDGEGQLWELHALKPGGEYELVISQTGGLLRYCLGDWVRCEGRVAQTPCLRFIGRGNTVADLVGEKLNERFVAALAARLAPSAYVCLLPDLARSGYCLLASAPQDLAAWEAGLSDNPHYRHARRLGQLQPLDFQLCPELSERLKDFFVTQRGLKRGDLKDRVLYARESDGQLLAALKSGPA
ncbi:MAG: GH3 family domain-containing protein [Candidatus Sericytochromatia bacterium]